jgi:PAS domain S-box-containing protein
MAFDQTASHGEELYQLLFETAGAAMVTIEDDTSISMCNPAFEQLSGFQRFEVENRLNWLDFVFQEDKEWMTRYHRDRRKSAARKVPSKYEFRFIDKKKNLKNVLVKVGMISGTRKSVATLIDITERKQMEQRLEERTQELRSVLDNIGIGVALISPQMEVLDLNRQMKEWFPEIDISKSPICYQAFNDPPRKDVCGYCPTCKTLRDGMLHESITSTPSDGKVVNYRIVSSPIINAHGKVVAAIEMVEDITQRLNTEERIQQAQKLESLGVLAGGIAHDFNNILTAVLGYTQLALDQTQSGTNMEDNLQEVYSAGLRAKDLVSQILGFARQTETELAPTKLSLIIEEAIKFLRASIPTTIEMKKKISSKSLVLVNPTQIHQLIMNLVTNAAQAIEPEEGRIDVSMEDVQLGNETESASLNVIPGNYVKIQVADTGPGIPTHFLGRIFEPFFTTKPIGEGTGMGLSVAHGIVKGHGGEIVVDSTPGKGSVFTIYLPVTESKTRKHSYKKKELPQGNERILFVDDEDKITKMGGQILKRLGYSVVTETSSLKALELFRSNPDQFDLVITDMTMPEMTGAGLTMEIRQIRKDIPIVLCSGYSKRLSDDLVNDLGADQVVYKPILKPELAKMIRNLLDRRG